MSSKTIDTALFSLSAGCLVIAILEIISQGWGYGYLWLMLSVGLWLAYMVRKRKRLEQAENEKTNKTVNAKTVRARLAGNKTKKVSFGGKKSNEATHGDAPHGNARHGNARSGKVPTSAKRSSESKGGQNRNNEQ